MSKKSQYKTVRVYESSFEKMNDLCAKYSLNKTELIESCLTFFIKTKIDPTDVSDVSAEVKKMKNQLISFIRTQEKEMLVPLIRKQDLLIEKFLNLIKEDLVDKKYLLSALTETAKQIVNKVNDDS
ncbi:hypothetical protein NH341_06450 [Tenacibaculum sp. XPcli2-G]|jgi:hypothetical protein|uniref:BfmA/BtgA family mobilization protein n=1 Tax=Tenacibaculum TaxID=104267 RepID=UPI000F5B7232|nr:MULTISPECIES: BfmA/BtgA family mobilization protein [Tenacibaculum]KAF9659984.1 hypothetical protein HBA12_07040 [Tenacibaculum mesophilum]MCO7185058.1 hypothetical protein [Tenacibaculum sp. XPcli2-G]